MSNVPKAREIIAEVIAEIVDPALRRKLMAANRLLVRVSPIRKSAVKLRLTDEHKVAIKKIAKANPDWSYSQIARKAGIPNIGRVSEVLHSQR
jgi:hypothetical protein